jgi:hypothetical protein
VNSDLRSHENSSRSSTAAAATVTALLAAVGIRLWSDLAFDMCRIWFRGGAHYLPKVGIDASYQLWSVTFPALAGVLVLGSILAMTLVVEGRRRRYGACAVISAVCLGLGAWLYLGFMLISVESAREGYPFHLPFTS